MQEMFTWKQFILVFLFSQRKLNFCVITEIMVTHTQKSRRTNNQRTRPWHSRQRVSLIILRSWVRASLVAVREKFFFLLLIESWNIEKQEKKKTRKTYNQLTHSDDVVSSLKSIYKKIRLYRSRAKRGWQMQEMFTWKQFIWAFLVLERKQNLCVITEIKLTDTQKSRRTNE